MWTCLGRSTADRLALQTSKRLNFTPTDFWFASIMYSGTSQSESFLINSTPNTQTSWPQRPTITSKQTVRVAQAMILWWIDILKVSICKNKKILSSFTHLTSGPNLYEFLCSVEHKQLFLKISFVTNIRKTHRFWTTWGWVIWSFLCEMSL